MPTALEEHETFFYLCRISRHQLRNTCWLCCHFQLNDIHLFFYGLLSTSLRPGCKHLL